MKPDFTTEARGKAKEIACRFRPINADKAELADFDFSISA
jgi:hypothetical protein